MPVTPDEVELLLAATTKGDLGLRNRALLRTLQRTGVRVSELIRLRPADIYDDTLRVVGSKRNRSRIIGLDPATAAAIAVWATRREARGLPTSGPLFCSMAGTPIRSNAVRELIRRLAIKAGGVDRRVTPHSFRHGFAAHLLRSGVGVFEIQKALGHESLAVTERYLRSFGESSAVRAVQQVAW